jgi:tetratricopeptide (TPR) repeat protein
MYRERIGELLCNVALCYVYRGEYVRAEATLEIALKNKPVYDLNFRMQYAFAKAKVDFGEGDYDKARKNFGLALRLSREQGDKHCELDTHCELAAVLLKQNQLMEAEHHLLEGERISRMENFAGNEALYRQFCILYRIKGDTGNLIKYQEKYIKVYEKLNNLSSALSFRRTELEHHEREHKLRLSAQEEALELKDQVINWQRLVVLAAVCICTLLAVLTILLMKANNKKKTYNVIMEQKVRERSKELEEKIQELRLELHGVRVTHSQALSITRHYISAINSLSDLASRDDKHHREYFEKVSTLAMDASVSIAKKQFELDPLNFT